MVALSVSFIGSFPRCSGVSSFLEKRNRKPQLNIRAKKKKKSPKPNKNLKKIK